MISKIINFIFIVILLSHSSCDKILFIEDISGEEIVLLAPLDDTQIGAGEVVFSWEELENADGYQLLIATPNFSNANQILLDSIVSTRFFSQQLLEGDYEWKLRAVNSEYNSAYVNANFIIKESDEFQKTKVILLEPSEDINTNNTALDFSWEAVDEAVEYRLQIWSPDVDGTLLEDEITSNTSYSYTFEEGDFTWQVRAQNSTQNTLFSLRTLLVDTTVPNEVTLEAPLDAASLSDTTVNFSWIRTEISGSIETDSLYVFNDAALTDIVFKGKGLSLEYEKVMETGTYFWYVQSFDAAGNLNTKTEEFTFDLN